MTPARKAHTIWIVALGVVILLLWWLWYRANQAAAAPNPPVTSTLGNPAPQITLNFQPNPNSFTNQPTGYVPLFGFLGYGGQSQ